MIPRCEVRPPAVRAIALNLSARFGVELEREGEHLVDKVIKLYCRSRLSHAPDADLYAYIS